MAALADHRRLGRELGLFATDELLGAGLPMWLPRGAVVRQELESFIVEQERAAGFQHVFTPALARRELYELSGHWAHYAEDMFPPMSVGDAQSVLRPMNCPHHALVYRSSGRSYRDLPLRLAELGAMYRAERSGVVGGLSRVRAMTLNDGHVFCAPEQVTDEVVAVLAMVRRAYQALGLTVGRFRLSLRGSGGKYAGDEARWEHAEGVLRRALDGLGLRYEEETGEAAFYGPKLDLQVRDALGHEETLSTVQVDFLLPRRFGLTYTGPDGRPRVPVMVHRSVVSTMERMVAHLIERHAGAFPPWLAPVQVAVLPVGADGARYAAVAVDRLAAAGLRVALHGAERSLGARIRSAQEQKVPYLAVIGAKEADAGHVALRLRDGRRLPGVALDEAVAGIADVVRRRSAALEAPVRA